MRSSITLALIAAIASSAHSQWSTMTLPVEQDQVSGAGTWNRIYVVGGWDASLAYAYEIQEYDWQDDDWNSDPLVLSTGRMKVACAVNGNLLFSAGGWIYPSGEEVGTVEIQDLAAHSMLGVENLSVPRVELSAASVGGKVLFAGGMNADWNGVDYTCLPMDVVDIYDVNTGTWSVAALTEAREGMASAVLGTKAYFAGGYKGSGEVSDRVDIYDSGTGTWSTATLSVPRAFYGGGVTVGGKVMFAGGITADETCSAVVDIYDPVADSWSTAALSTAREGVQAASVGDYAIFAGGGCGVINWYYTSSSSVVDIYNAATDTWTTSNMSAERINFMAATSGNKVFLIGGYDLSTNEDPVVIDVFTDAATIGFEEIAAGTSLNAWPNPFTDIVNLGALSALAGCTVEVYDARGVRTRSLRSKNDLRVDLSDLEDGLYYLRVLPIDGSSALTSGPMLKLR